MIVNLKWLVLPHYASDMRYMRDQVENGTLFCRRTFRGINSSVVIFLTELCVFDKSYLVRHGLNSECRVIKLSERLHTLIGAHQPKHQEILFGMLQSIAQASTPSTPVQMKDLNAHLRNCFANDNQFAEDFHRLKVHSQSVVLETLDESLRNADTPTIKKMGTFAQTIDKNWAT